jgi:hypothetical protein
MFSIFAIIVSTLKLIAIAKMDRLSVVTPESLGAFEAASKAATRLRTFVVVSNVLMIMVILAAIAVMATATSSWLMALMCLGAEMVFIFKRTAAARARMSYYDPDDKALMRKVLLFAVLGATALLYESLIYWLSVTLR